MRDQVNAGGTPWVICNEENAGVRPVVINGVEHHVCVPDLTGRFIMGSASITAAPVSGGPLLPRVAPAESDA
eukprot:37016-Eustigmatos_ZCMA.PRE.1